MSADEDCHHGHSDDDDCSHDDDDDDVVDSKDTLFHDDAFAMNNFLIAFWNSRQVWICPHVGGWLLRETNLQLEGFVISILYTTSSQQWMMEHNLNLSLVINFFETGSTRLQQFQACEVAANGE